MAKLLYIESSPRKERSKSIMVAKAFIDKYTVEHAGDEVVAIDLWEKKLPEFDGYTIDAKYQVLHGQGLDANQQAAWQAVVAIDQTQHRQHTSLPLRSARYGAQEARRAFA